MNDEYISRKEAILQIQRYGVGCLDADEFTPEQCERFVISKLQELPSVESFKVNEWISVSERLPEIRERVLVSYNVHGEQVVNTTYYDEFGFLIGKVDAWMPMPEPYRRGSDNNDT